MKEQVYKDDRPAEYFDRFHDRVRRGPPDVMYEIVRIVLTPFLVLFYRTRAIDTGKVPSDGAVIIAPNHFSFMDHFFIAVYLRRKVQFVAKSQLFKPPIQFIFSHGGVFPIRRGHRDEEAFKTAHAVLARGGVVVMYAEGGRSRSDELGEPKPGVGRLALESGVPVVPAAIAGSAKVRNWTRFQFPKVTVQYGDAMRFEQVAEPSREQAQAASEVVFEEIETLYGELQKNGRRGAIQAARSARHAGEAAGRRPAPHS